LVLTEKDKIAQIVKLSLTGDPIQIPDFFDWKTGVKVYEDRVVLAVSVCHLVEHVKHIVHGRMANTFGINLVGCVASRFLDHDYRRLRGNAQRVGGRWEAESRESRATKNGTLRADSIVHSEPPVNLL
jgi:hypothetical protein